MSPCPLCGWRVHRDGIGFVFTGVFVMSLSHQEVEKIAHLARLQITEQEVDGYRDALSKILGLVEQLNQIDTKNVEPMAHPFDAAQRLRVDEVSESNQRELFQTCAQAVQDGLYLVPKVIE